jgi:hypothetical protein
MPGSIGVFMFSTLRLGPFHSFDSLRLSKPWWISFNSIFKAGIVFADTHRHILYFHGILRRRTVCRNCFIYNSRFNTFPTAEVVVEYNIL